MQSRYLGTANPYRVAAFHAQLQDPRGPLQTPQTLTEKIVQRYVVGLPKGKAVKTGDYVSLAPQQCMTHDNSWPVALKFMSMGASKLHDPTQIVMTLDHDVQNKSDSNLKKYKQIEEFAKKHGVDFYPAGRGIGHQIMVEAGYAWPASLTVASDSHANHYGGVGSLGTPITRSDAACIWATGRTWWQIPPIVRVNFTGILPFGVTGKDVIVALCGLFNKDEILNHAVEFAGSEEAMASLPVDARLTISNMTTEWGALSGLFPVDNILRNWLRYKATEAALPQSSETTDAFAFKRFSHEKIDKLFDNPLFADPGANYAKCLHLNLSTLSPYVSGPNSVKVATPLEKLSALDVKINKAYLVSCTNSRASDLAAAARVFKEAAKLNNGKIPRIAPGVKFYIAAASIPEQLAAEDAGDWQAMLDAGAIGLPAGCGPCIGLGEGLLEPGEVGISASNRNFKGRMGSTEAKAYLASPEVVAASALNGKISGPGWYNKPEGWSGVVIGEGNVPDVDDPATNANETINAVIGQIEHFDSMIEKAEKEFAPESTTESEDQKGQVEILDGFPELVEGEILFCDADNINTDGIYPGKTKRHDYEKFQTELCLGKYTYQDNMTEYDMAQVCMSNFDTAFSSIAKPGDILVSGFSFGVGSSREQAATAILAKKIPLVVAGSFSNIFQRNSINNALMTVEVPKLVHRLRETFSTTLAQRPKQNVQEEPSANKDSLDSPPPASTVAPVGEKVLTRRTGWKLIWDVRRSKVVVQEGPNGPTWSQKVGDLPPNVQEIIACGGLEKWVQKEISKKP